MFWACVASAADVVVRDGVDADAAIARASWATGRPAEALEVVEAATVTGGPMVIGAAVAWCDGAPADAAAVDYLLDRVQGDVEYGAFDTAPLDQVEAAVRCARGLGATDVARWHLLRGAVAAGLWREDEARVAYGAARSADPAATWNAAWPGEDAFVAPAAPTTRARGLGPVTLDGCPLGDTIAIVAGPHAIAAADRTGILSDAAEAVTVVDPSGLAPGGFADEASRAVAAGALAGRFGEGSPVIVVTPRSVWSSSAGDPSWVELERRRGSLLVPVGLVAAGVGGLVAGIGAVPTLASQADAREAAGAMARADGTASFVEAERRYEQNVGDLRRVRMVPYAGAGLAGVGVVVTGVGLALGPSSVRP